MHVSGVPLDLNWFLQFIVTVFVIAFGLLHLVKNTAARYFVVDANFESPSDSAAGDHRNMPGVIGPRDSCAVCGSATKKQCSGCKSVKYCSEACQRSHWKSGHKTRCKDFQLLGKVNSTQSTSVLHGRKFSAVSLVSDSGTSKNLRQSKKILFPYEEFVELFNWDKAGFPPRGLLNCGNSCFANVVLQCLSCTRPLVAYLLEKGHKRQCKRNDWCFLCEFQTHVERASCSIHPFSPLNILSRLPNIGGNLGYGKQEDAHEFMRFAIDVMQSACLEEFGGERAVHPSSQETTLIQHIFGGHLQSQVICTKCRNVSNQFENMMDLTVEIQGDAASLEECLDQFTAKEQLHGDNMYKCDECNEYVMAWKRLTVRRAPNILTIALKRFQSGRFGKLNKRVTFPETLVLNPYMSETGDDNDVYKLYAVVVHVDMLNASYFGHYICYTKDFCGNWYRIDDCKVVSVELDEVLSQGAYMLLYSRVCARPSCLYPTEPTRKEDQDTEDVAKEIEPCPEQLVKFSSAAAPMDTAGCLPSDSSSQAKVSSCKDESFSTTISEDATEDLDADFEPSSSASKEIEVEKGGYSNTVDGTAASLDNTHELISFSLTDTHSTESDILKCERLSPVVDTENGHGADLRCAKETGLVDAVTKGSVRSQDCAYEKGDMLQDVSASALSSGEILHETDFVDSRRKPEVVESRKSLPSSSGTEDAEGKFDLRNSSVVKLKPLISPGFLGKRPRNNVIKQNGKAPAKFGELPDKPGLPHQNGGRMEVWGQPCPENNSSPPQFLEKHARKCCNEGLMVTIESGSQSNADSGVSIISDESIYPVMKDEKPLVLEQTLMSDGETHGPSKATTSGKRGTDSHQLA